MSTDTQWFDDLDPKIESKADYGVPAARKAAWSDAEAPLHVLAANGVDIPHREYIDSPDDARTLTTTVRWTPRDAVAGVEVYPEHENGSIKTVPTDNSSAVGTTVHLHQDVRERTEETFGNLGAATEDADDVTWTVVGLDGGTVDLTVVGDWGKRRSVPYEDFADEYEPLTLRDGQPQWGY